MQIHELDALTSESDDMLSIDFDQLLQLPEDNTVEEQVNIVQEEELGQGSIFYKNYKRNQCKHHSKSNALGPEQGEASG
eukprot:14299805-Ditylum_brightwellii.AAC.1